MTIRAFIRENRAEIDAHIRRVFPNVGRLNDDDRREWVMNDETLYLRARRSGCAL